MIHDTGVSQYTYLALLSQAPTTPTSAVKEQGRRRCVMSDDLPPDGRVQLCVRLLSGELVAELQAPANWSAAGTGSVQAEPDL